MSKDEAETAFPVVLGRGCRLIKKDGERYSVVTRMSLALHPDISSPVEMGFTLTKGSYKDAVVIAYPDCESLARKRVACVRGPYMDHEGRFWMSLRAYGSGVRSVAEGTVIAHVHFGHFYPRHPNFG